MIINLLTFVSEINQNERGTGTYPYVARVTFPNTMQCDFSIICVLSLVTIYLGLIMQAPETQP